MKILVFGKTGQLARAIQRQADVIAVGREKADLSDPDQCCALIDSVGPDAVINAAAYTAVDRAQAERDAAFAVNRDAPIAMAKHAAALDIPFIHVTTDYVFDGSGDQARAPDAVCAPLQVYGQSKREGELGVVAAGGRYGILRTSWVFSADGANFVTKMLEFGRTRDRMTIVADQIGGPTSARAIAQTCLTMARALAVDESKVGIYHLSGYPDVSWAGFAREIFARSGSDVDVTDIPTTEFKTPATRPLNSRLDCTSLFEAFGIERPDWRIDLAQVLDDLK